MPRMIFALTLALAACGGSSTQGTGAGTTPTTASGSGAGSDQECHEENVIGSSIPRQVCRSKMQSDIDRKGAQDWENTAIPHPQRGN